MYDEQPRITGWWFRTFLFGVSLYIMHDLSILVAGGTPGTRQSGAPFMMEVAERTDAAPWRFFSDGPKNIEIMG